MSFSFVALHLTIQDKKIAENFLEKFNSESKNFGKIISVEEKNKIENQRLPYSLSTLQIETGKKFCDSPQTVLDTMQNLYEKKLTIYPRSDCEFLPENQLGDAREILENLKNFPHLADFVKFPRRLTLSFPHYKILPIF